MCIHLCQVAFETTLKHCKINQLLEIVYDVQSIILFCDIYEVKDWNDSINRVFIRSFFACFHKKITTDQTVNIMNKKVIWLYQLNLGAPCYKSSALTTCSKPRRAGADNGKVVVSPCHIYRVLKAQIFLERTFCDRQSLITCVFWNWKVVKFFLDLNKSRSCAKLVSEKVVMFYRI